MTVSAYDSLLLKLVSMKLVWWKRLGLFVSITSIEEPTDDFTHVTSDIRFESEEVSRKSDK